MKAHVDGVHRGIKKFDCEKCEKSFSQKSNLKAHINAIHEGMKQIEFQFYMRGKNLLNKKILIIFSSLLKAKRSMIVIRVTNHSKKNGIRLTMRNLLIKS